MFRGAIFFRHICRSTAFGFALSVLAACTEFGWDQDEPLATRIPSKGGLQLNSTGFFVDWSGHVLTAGHAAANCARLYIGKDGRTAAAVMVAAWPVQDLALLKADETMGAPAVFARNVRAEERDAVFVAGYQVLQDMLGRGGTLFNGIVARGREQPEARAAIELVSDATYGSSGAPVLSSDGLVIGIVTHKTMRTRVVATNADDAKAFLAANQIAFTEDERAQLGGFEDRARHAASFSVSVTCQK
jgi:S1-C subfamily serine protease